MTASVWEPVPGIAGPCADISFERPASGNALVVTMHFSRTKGLPNRDLRLRFDGPLALRWEDECPGFDPVPDRLPKCATPEWREWTFPLLTVQGAELLDQVRAVRQWVGEPAISHFLLVSMNDLIQIVARSEVSAEWGPGVATD
jgi:hypothetical protein